MKQVLIGDDEEEVRTALARELELMQFEVDLARNPQEVIAKARTNIYSAVVTDLEYTVDGREGYQVLKEIKDVCAVKILYTGLSGFEHVLEGFEHGADHVVLGKNQLTLVEILNSIKRGEKNE
jgi:DNA-binding response OmpR family regulator